MRYRNLVLSVISRRSGTRSGLLMLLAVICSLASSATWADPPLRENDGATARSLLDRFAAIDWNVRASMSKQPTQDDAAWKTRLEVESKLVALGPDAVPILIQALTNSNRHVRALASAVLGERGEKSAVESLRSIVSGDKDATARLYAAEALGRIGTKTVRDTLEKARSSDENTNVRYAAEQALIHLNSEGAGNLLRNMASTFNPDRMALAKVDSPAPDLALENEEGQNIRLSEFRGRKPVLVLFQLADW